MNIPKQLVNLLGGVVVLAVVAAGLLLGAVPLWTDSTSITADADLVAQSNLGYEVQIASLRENEDDLDDIQDTVDQLRREIPAEPRLDEVFEIVARAAAASGVTIVSATSGYTTAWTPREPLTPGALPADEAAATDQTDPSSSAPADPATDPAVDPATDPAAADPAAGTGKAPVEPAPRQAQIDFTLVLTAPSPEAADQFIDALGEGARLIGIVHADLGPNETGYDLTVNALAFVRSEN
jgi:hypothetical protein